MMALEIRGLHKSFGGLTVIRDLNLAVPKGERHAVIGPNGAGKTTLFNLVTGWISPCEGSILIDGVPVIPGQPDLVTRAGMARSFQKNMLLENLTVLENLRIACQAFHRSRRSLFSSCLAFAEVVDRARAAAERMHLESSLDRKVKELSYGQKRQLEVAIALCAEPKILLMDEPAAGTSPGERAKLVELVNELPAGLTMILVEHDMDVVFAVCDRITVLSYGQVLASGTKDEIRKNQDVRDAYLGRAHA